jgi:hypothetical protein
VFTTALRFIENEGSIMCSQELLSLMVHKSSLLCSQEPGVLRDPKVHQLVYKIPPLAAVRVFLVTCFEGNATQFLISRVPTGSKVDETRNEVRYTSHLLQRLPTGCTVTAHLL